MTEALGNEWRAFHISAMALEGQAVVARQQGQPEEAERLDAEAKTAWGEMGRIAEMLSGEGV